MCLCSYSDNFGLELVSVVMFINSRIMLMIIDRLKGRGSPRPTLASITRGIYILIASKPRIFWPFHLLVSCRCLDCRDLGTSCANQCFLLQLHNECSADILCCFLGDLGTVQYLVKQ